MHKHVKGYIKAGSAWVDGVMRNRHSLVFYRRRRSTVIIL